MQFVQDCADANDDAKWQEVEPNANAADPGKFREKSGVSRKSIQEW